MSERRTLRRSSRLETRASEPRTGETVPTNTEEKIEETHNTSVTVNVQPIEETPSFKGGISTGPAAVNPIPEKGVKSDTVTLSRQEWEEIRRSLNLLKRGVSPPLSNSPTGYTTPSNIRTPFRIHHEQADLEESSPSDSSMVSKFIAEYDIYEAMVVRRRFGLSVADLSLCLTNEVKVDLVEEGFDMIVQAKILKYLRKIKKNEDRSRSKIVIREVEGIQWKNLGSPSASMRAFLKAADKILRGIHFDNKSIEKEVCLKIIKRLPTEFGSSRAKERQTEEGWRTYKLLKRGLRRAAISISTWDIQISRDNQKDSSEVGNLGGVSGVAGDSVSPTVESVDPVDIPEMYMVEMGDWKVAEVSSNSSDEEVGPAEEGEVPDYAEHAYYRDELSDEILRKEYEVGASSSKPHIDTPKMQQLLNNKIEKKVEDLVKTQALNLE
eukprot:augustus_masked-scaffold_56-processed-gene-0.2-mRNA-1 protein AED:1.00 eAED:1.00 QI:0/0/0/0/1/1/3/0/437